MDQSLKPRLHAVCASSGGETNYVSATLAIYLDVYNVFQSLVSILGFVGGDRD